MKAIQKESEFPLKSPNLAFIYNNVEYYDIDLTGAKKGVVYTEEQKKFGDIIKVSKGSKEHPSAWLRRINKKKPNCLEVTDDKTGNISYYETFKSQRAMESRIFIRKIKLVDMGRILCSTFYHVPENGDFDAEHKEDKKNFKSYMDANYHDNVIPLSNISHQEITNEKARQAPKKAKEVKQQKLYDEFEGFLNILDEIIDESSAFIRHKGFTPSEKLHQITQIKNDCRKKIYSFHA